MAQDDKKVNQFRRGFLGTTLKAIPVAAITAVGAGKVAHAIPEAPGSVDSMADLPENPAKYMPTFFNDEEYDFIQSAVDLLIPEDELGPGAIATGVPEFIDRQMDTPYGHGQLWYMKGPFHPEIMKQTPTLGYQLNMTPRDIYKSGITAFNQWCIDRYKRQFVDLNHQEQTEAMTLLSDGKIEFPDDAVFASVFFSQLWGNCKEGFFSDPMYGGNRDMAGWQMVGFPGARGDYLDWADRYNVEYPLPPVSILPKK
ncbi:gluconate 2-dehydrogenase [Ignatzschineria sp. F8392]|uniref:gluconate 2-dehydrogenase subunit 3 family protein n=1 Tax=Ignatzschineria sp. F8392 TaxID=1980117 RepID=UPI000B98A9A0|nr:gluconate 2-dehydrogenase subunit 3 family protein [Ignatzschineria sp. F8392]OYQ77483.1 gluconate 2-dehydrogenase [Ignatzschineria sp. F8392]